MEANHWPNDPLYSMVLRVGNRKQPLGPMEWRCFFRDHYWNWWNGAGFQMVARWFGHCSNNPLVTNHRSGLPRTVVKLVTHLKTPEQDILDHLNLYCIDIMDLLAAIINRAVICEERYAAQEQYIWPCLVIRTLVSSHQIMRRSQRFEWMRIINTTANGAHRFNSWTAVKMGAPWSHLITT